MIQGCSASRVIPRLSDNATDAEKQYIKGISLFYDSMYPEAIAAFNDVKNKYPYSDFAALAQLQLGEVEYDKREFTAAVDAYQLFLKYYPGHQKSDYAMYRIAESYFEQVPSEWWFLPPAAEKDQAVVRRALTAYHEMLTQFPNSEYAKEADEKHKICRNRLADHEIYVARFYQKRNKDEAAVSRLQATLTDYGGAGSDPEILQLLAISLDRLGKTEEAIDSLEQLIKSYPTSPEALKARVHLQEMRFRPMTSPP